jgi:deazaflavin-dependent oxidoreductase (nitroreductase family)
MPMPRWLAKVNRRVFNPIEIRRGVRPVLVHTGRSSGTTYRTPLDAHPVPDGYVFIPNYGAGSDWVQNTLAAGSARLVIGGEEIELTSPRLVRKADVWSSLAPGTKTPPGIKDGSQLLRMDLLPTVGSPGSECPCGGPPDA